MSLTNRTAVISGATGGLGSQLARDLAARGAKLALIDIDPARLQALADELALPDDRILLQVVNLLDPAQANAAAEAAAAHFGRIDILLHVVGGWSGGKTVLEIPASDLEFMLNQHVWTSFHVTRAFLPHLLSNGWGRIIMVTSPLAARPNAKSSAYAIGKAGQEALMLTLSQELAGSGVTANLLQARSIDVKREKLASPAAAKTSNATTPEELSAAVLYLLSDEAGTINGAKIPMYGSYN
jgi:NAD(P)-dependent dehydrogenase (short-subunit alcohol dehydrogenase family)